MTDLPADPPAHDADVDAAANAQAPAESNVPADLVAQPGRYYRNARYIVVVGMIIVGCWFAYDGWVRYPGYNASLVGLSPAQLAGLRPPHQYLDIILQKIIAVTLTGAALPMLGWFLYRSRGVYRLSGSTLYVPGHPPVPLDAIVDLDKSKWDRKGIAYVEYQVNSTQDTRRLTLDDFIYDRQPTDQIVKQIEDYLQSTSAEAGDEQI